MIKDKRVIGKATRALSACLAVVMTAAAVFAGGVLADGVLGSGSNDDGNVIKYEIYDGDRLIETAHEPFIYNGDYYLPLRETLNGFGYTDISYANGVAAVTVPEDEEIAPIPTGSEGSYFRYFSFDANEGSFTSITFGEREMYASNNRPVIVDGVMYAPIESFMAIMQYYSSFADFRLNVIKPTDPESYYAKGEEVVIGTAAEQDKYTNENPNKKVKRIVTDNNGKVILVVSTQNQELETKHRLFTNSWRNIENFTRIFEGVNYLKNFRGEECIRPDEWEINPTGTDEAFFAVITAADWVTFPTNESGDEMNEIITNTYDEVYGAQQFIGEGFSVKIPDSWSGKYIVNTDKDGDTTSYSFIQKATYDKYGAGTLCIVERVSPETADELLNMLGGSELLYSDENYAYIYEIPTDVQYPVWADHDEEDAAIAAEYEEMFGQVDVIKNSFELTDNTETTPPFTDEEVAAARAVVEEYWRAKTEHDRVAILKTVTEPKRADNVVYFREGEKITLNDIRYNPFDSVRTDYIETGRGSVNGTKYEDVIVFRVDYTVDDKGYSAYNEGPYPDWHMILIRDGKGGEWLIDDQGY